MTHVHTLFLKDDLPFDIFVVGRWRLRLIVEQEQELVRYLLLNFYGFVVTNKVEGCYLNDPVNKFSVLRDWNTDRLFGFGFIQVFRKTLLHVFHAIMFELDRVLVLLRQVIRQEVIAIRLHRSHNGTVQPGIVNLRGKNRVSVIESRVGP